MDTERGCSRHRRPLMLSRALVSDGDGLVWERPRLVSDHRSVVSRVDDNDAWSSRGHLVVVTQLSAARDDDGRSACQLVVVADGVAVTWLGQRPITDDFRLLAAMEVSPRQERASQCQSDTFAAAENA